MYPKKNSPYLKSPYWRLLFISDWSKLLEKSPLPCQEMKLNTFVFLILIYMIPTIGLWWFIIKRVWKIAMFWWESIQRNKTTLTESLLTWSKIPFMLFIFQIFCENTDAKKCLIRKDSNPWFDIGTQNMLKLLIRVGKGLPFFPDPTCRSRKMNR